MDTERVQPTGDDELETEPLLDDDEPELGSIAADPGDDSDLEASLEDDDYEDEDDEDDQQRALGGSFPEAPPADLEGLVHYVVSKLVAEPESIEISSEHRGGTMYISLRVPESDLGRVIGREGRTAKAIRTLVSIAGSKSNVHARLDIDG